LLADVVRIVELDLVWDRPLGVLVGVRRRADLHRVPPLALQECVWTYSPRRSGKYRTCAEHAEEVEQAVVPLAGIEAEVQGRTGRALGLRWLRHGGGGF
jgi:hypothetical protein